MVERLRQSVAVLIFVMQALVVFCTDNALSGGGGIDVGNPAKVCVLDSLNKPVADASVKIVPVESWFKNLFLSQSVAAESSFTGNSGYVFFDSLAEGVYTIQVDHPSGGALVAEVTLKDSQVTTVVLKKYGSISGTVNADTGVPEKIHLVHTTYGANIDNDGTFRINKIPEGVYTSVMLGGNSQWTTGGGISVKPVQDVQFEASVAFKKLLIDDFEDTAVTGKLACFVKGGHIFTAAQANSEASGRYEIVTDVEKGKVLKSLLIRKNLWALVGFSLGIKADNDSLWDFHLARGLSFQAKGSGRLNVSIESDSLDRRGFYKQYSSTVLLQNEWKSYIISFDSLSFFKDFNEDPDIPWSAASRSVKRIEFNALEGDTVQFWLDNLTIDGVSFSDVY